MYTTAITTPDSVYVMQNTLKADAEQAANDAVAHHMQYSGVTGGIVADWRNVTLYCGSVDRKITIVTVYTR